MGKRIFLYSKLLESYNRRLEQLFLIFIICTWTFNPVVLKPAFSKLSDTISHKLLNRVDAPFVTTVPIVAIFTIMFFQSLFFHNSIFIFW